MNQDYYAIGILIMASITVLLRAIPFLIFSGRRKVPGFITRWNQMLPYSVMMMLVVYCLRNLTFASPGGFLPEVICSGVVVLLHLWKHNTILSITAGTVLYMVFVQAVF